MSERVTAQRDIEQAQRQHRDGINHVTSAWGPWCYRCQTEYPCLTARLAARLGEGETEVQRLKADIATHREMELGLIAAALAPGAGEGEEVT